MSYDVFTVREESTDEKYLTFLPHSGLHNQRIALINALVIAKALNRTLIMPELNLGIATFWRPSLDLEQKLDECPGKDMTGGCFDYRRYIPVPTGTIFDLSSLETLDIRVIERLDMRRDYFERHWGVPPDERNKTLVYNVPDNTRYSYQLYDSRDGKKHPANFAIKMYLDDLRSRPEKFMMFGSLFGTHRLVLEADETLVTLREQLRQELVVVHPEVLGEAAKVINRLGGPAQFVSVHLRQGDGVFRKTATATMAKVRASLEDLGAGTRDDKAVERLSQLGTNRTQLLKECVRLSSVDPRLQLIYMATDAPHPTERFAHLYSEFLCLFSLHDFRVTISKILIPLVDAEIAAQASTFVGTPKSTYTGYIQQRNDHFLYTRAS
ncbi:hypothetical protein DFQ28_009300 [Apophysomyces sp. BC1034]|nr:hypothetical protein DFQ30_009038 [Apophysomyces sp. BC1015]KAG0173215.1 hypothetical protein DFQ29_008044 [Apophysomyces sp. BC1021]KAG0185443.1 hypothetical protein DFQ28_009300 [Apophysomyces sp. BC1034]